MAGLQINYLDFLQKVSDKSMDFEENSISFKSVSKEVAKELKDISSKLSFTKCKLVFEDFSQLENILLNNIDSLDISVENCQIFIRFFNFRDAFNLKKFEFFKTFYNNELIIYNALFDYSKDSLEDLDELTDFFRSRKTKVVVSAKLRFAYYPEDFDRFIDILKFYKLQNVHLDFLYTSQQTETIPNLICFSSILGQLRIRNANLNRRELPFCYNLYIENCKGATASICRNITISRSRNFDIRFFPGTKLFIEEGSYGKIYCKGKFSMFFDNPSEYDDNAIEIVEGSIRSTNKKSLLKERHSIYKYKLFVNEDFSFDNKITKFYKCKFLNCFFNSNQYLLDCEYSKCYFSEGMDFVINT